MSSKKQEQLGMNPATAATRLKKMILFRMAQRLGEDVCFRCGVKIDRIDQFTVEHKEPWLDSEDPTGLFFSLDNIAFSHSSCNTLNSRSRSTPYVELRCDWCEKDFERPVRIHKKNQNRKAKHTFCSRPCGRHFAASEQDRENGQFIV